MYTLLTSWMAADRVLGMGGGSRIVVAHGFRKIHSLRHGDGDRCRLEMPTSASWLGAQTPSYAFGHSIGHRDLLTDNTSTRWAELWRPQGRSLRWMDGRGIIARSRTPVDHLKFFAMFTERQVFRSFTVKPNIIFLCRHHPPASG